MPSRFDVVCVAAAAAIGLASCDTTPRVEDPSRSAAPGSFAVIAGEPAAVPRVAMGDGSTVRRVIREAKNDSRVMDHLTELCETFGARLTGSSACEGAAQWARDRFAAWGLENARLQPWGQLRARFDRLDSVGEIVSMPERRDDDDDNAEPDWRVDRSVEFTTLSWTRGTNGPTLGRVVRMPETIDEVDPAGLAGAWVLLPAQYGNRRGVRGVGFSMRERNDLRHEIRTGVYNPFAEAPAETWAGHLDFEGTPMPVTFTPRRDDDGRIVGGRIEMPEFYKGDVTDVIHEDNALRMVWPNTLEESAITLVIDGETMTGTAGSGEHALTLARTAEPDERAMTRESDRVLARVLEAEPAGFLSASSDDRVWTTRANGWQEIDPADLPRDIEISIRRSDYDYLNSRLADGQELHARFNLDHRVELGPFTAHNVIAEIPGATRPDEVVIVSAHLDSWDGPGSQGTIDNGTGSAVVLEAARLLAQARARPDRTIRFILWTGEEQGLLGSDGYVKSLSDDERARISAVFVDDGGTNYQGGLPAADHMVDFLAAATAPINNQFYSQTDGQFLNVDIRPTGPEIKTHGGSDHASFNAVGIPGFFWDEVGRADYGHGWHTQNDRLDQAIPEYLVQSSACMAVTAYNLASAPALLPRTPQTAPADDALDEQAAAGR